MSLAGIICRLQQWWLNHSPGTTGGAVCRVLPSLICWGLWKARNTAIYDGVVLTPTQICWNIQALLLGISQVHPFVQVTRGDCELVSSGLFLRMKRRQLAQPRWIAWAKPSIGYVKLNIDDSSLGNPGHDGAGGVFRDSDGNILAGFSLFLGSRTNMEAEAMALLEGLQSSASFHSLQVEMDSQALLNMVNGNGRVPWRLWHTISCIQSLVLDRQVIFTHVYREANAVADGLACLASSTCVSQSFPPSPLSDHIRGLARLDRIQMPYVRLA